MIGLAYTGTANNAAIQKLLHFAVSDVSNDVRRAAVMNLGFVLASTPGQCPAIVSLLAESFNPHVRYGAAMVIRSRDAYRAVAHSDTVHQCHLLVAGGWHLLYWFWS